MKNLVDALDNFKDKNILVYGDLILDKFSWGEIKKLNPEQHAAPNVNVEENEETYALGGAANVANNIVSLGGKCELYGVLGKDYSGEKIKELCKEKGIILKPVYNGNKTLLKQRIMAHGQQVTRLNYGEKNRKKIDLRYQKNIEENLEKCDFIIFSDYNKGFFNDKLSQQIIKSANTKKIPILVDSKPQNLHYFKDCTIIRPNKKEAFQMTGIKYENKKDVLEEMGRKLCERVNSKYAIITLGKDGVFKYEKEKSVMIETKARQVRDVTGAGDTFAATLALSLASGLSMSEAIKIANYASGVVVEKQGTATTTTDEIKKKIKEDSTDASQLIGH